MAKKVLKKDSFNVTIELSKMFKKGWMDAGKASKRIKTAEKK